MRIAFVYILRHRVLIALLAAFLWLSIMTVIGLSAIAVQSRGELRASAGDAVMAIDGIYAQIDTVFDGLLASTAAPCSREMILQMRRAMFLNDHIQNILYFADGAEVPECSANMGRLSGAAPLPPPAPLSQTRFNRQVWFDLPVTLFGGTVGAYVVKQGHFAITADMEELRNLPIAERWETFVPGANGAYVLHVDGQAGLHQDYLEGRHSVFGWALMYSQCSHHVAACITIVRSFPLMLKHYSLFAAFAGVLSLTTAAMAYVMVSRWLALLASPAGRIRSAISRRQGFHCLYQPIVELTSGQPIGCEVLARFRDELGDLYPDQFIPIVLKLGKTWEFTEIILAISLPELKPLTARHPDFKVSVNFFPLDLNNNLLDRITASRPLNYAIENDIRLNCELLETGFGDATLIGETLLYLHAQKFTVAIDDFGTGTSNLKQIRGMKANFIKVDKSFISGLSIENASVRSSLIPHIVDIAREVGVEVIAEGVETPAQVQVLESQHIRYGQGYFFSRPAGVHELERQVMAGEALEGLSGQAPSPSPVSP
jgi:sensor c-di-GMP phosphodiesterase-like protein